MDRKTRFSCNFNNSWRLWGLYGAESRFLLGLGISFSDFRPLPFPTALMFRGRAVYSVGFRNSSSGSLVPFPVIRVPVSGFKNPGSEFRVSGFWHCVSVASSQFPGSGIRVSGSRALLKTHGPYSVRTGVWPGSLMAPMPRSELTRSELVEYEGFVHPIFWGVT